MLYYGSGSLVCCMVLLLQTECIMSVSATPSMTSTGPSTASASSLATQVKDQGKAPVTRPVISFGRRLGRVTAYWASEGDYYTGRLLSATGVHLHGGHCAVDPRIIPYGSVVEVAGVGKFLAVDTGSAVVSRKAARENAHTSEERKALVIDLFFKSRKAGEAFTFSTPKYAFISWRPPSLPSTFLPAPVITPISMLLRLGILRPFFILSTPSGRHHIPI